MKKWQKLLISILFTGIALSCFHFPDSYTITETINVEPKMEKKVDHNVGIKSFCEYVGLFFLIMAVWIWRKELKINQFYGIGGRDEITQQTPDDKPPSSGKPDDNIIQTKDDYIEEEKNKEIEEHIVATMQERPHDIFTLTSLSSMLGYSRTATEKALYSLMKKNMVRKDIYPGKRMSIYTLSKSINNQSIDYFIREYVNEEIISDYRYVRLKMQYDIDAIIKTKTLNYIVELKFFSNRLISKTIDLGIQQLLKIEEEINLEPIVLVLLLIGKVENKSIIEKKYHSLKPNLRIIFINQNKFK